jgi:hypothetical protein
VREPRDFKRVEELYHAALARGTDQREAFLKEACLGNEGLLHEVKSLLGYEEEANRLLEEPVVQSRCPYHLLERNRFEIDIHSVHVARVDNDVLAGRYVRQGRLRPRAPPWSNRRKTRP